jgi:biotin carboxylase
MNLVGKKLLILGSTAPIAEIVKKAQELGVFVVVSDYVDYQDAPAKQISDSYLDISLADTEALAKYIYTNRIDGVLTGFTDSYLPYYQRLCEMTGLPCYGTKEQFEIATNKDKFKSMCSTASVPVIPGTSIKTEDELYKSMAYFDYPIMLKPVDNSGSRGVIKCESEEQLKKAYEYALSFSPSKSVICEKYMACDSMSVSYQLVNGIITLSLTSDRTVYKSPLTGSSVAAFSTYPSVHTARYVSEMNERVIKMLEESAFRNGILSMQAFVDSDSFYMCEMCYRPSGGCNYVVIQKQNGIDGLAMLIEYAVSGTVKGYDQSFETPFFNNEYLRMRILGKQHETIAEISGIEELRERNEVISVNERLCVGSTIGNDGTTSQAIVLIWCQVPKSKTTSDLVNEIVSSISVKNNTGESIIKETRI